MEPEVIEALERMSGRTVDQLLDKFYSPPSFNCKGCRFKPSCQGRKEWCG